MEEGKEEVHAGGRPPMFKEEFVDIIYNMAKIGKNKTEISSFLGISRSVFFTDSKKNKNWDKAKKAFVDGKKKLKDSLKLFDKTCNRCGKEKNNIDFPKNKSSIDGLSPWCMSCHKEKSYEYKRTKKGLIYTVYSSQKNSSKRRGHNPPTYTKKDLLEWCLSQRRFHVLYDNWKRLDYQKDYSPSIDRIDDNIGYTMSNIQLMTWGENSAKWKNRNK